MSRRNRNGDEDHFDLLPFIAVLLCTLGCLLFVTLAMASLNLGSTAEVWDLTEDGTMRAIPGSPKQPDQVLPLLVEWDGETAKVHLESGTVSIRCAWKQDGESAGEAGAGKLADTMAALKSTRYALFVVRPTGFGTFNRVAATLRDRGLKIGSDPAEQGQEIKLKLPQTGGGGTAGAAMEKRK